MKNILFITYFWPPSGKASLHWPLFIIKHLMKQRQWNPIVLTADEDTFSHVDHSLLSEVDSSIKVEKTRANDPFKAYRKFLGKSPDSPLIASETISLENSNWKHKLAIWIRMNLFVPDARVGWNFSAIKKARTIAKEQHIAAIVSIGPPHSSHLIGKKLSKQHNIPHFPVLIDPWVDIVYYRNFSRNYFTLALDNYFERSTLFNAQRVIFVTAGAQEDYCKKYPWLSDKSDVLYWGYNEENFTEIESHTPTNTTGLILHAGNIFDYQNPIGLWKNIKTEIDRGRKLKVRFIGTVSPGIRKSISELGLNSVTEYSGFLPYQEVITAMLQAEYLLVCATERRHVPGKLFEYLRAGKKIIAFGDDNAEVEQLLQRSTAGKLFPYHYQDNNIFRDVDTATPDPAMAQQYSREHIAAELGALIQRSIEEPANNTRR